MNVAARMRAILVGWSTPPRTIISGMHIGDPAPDFELVDLEGKRHRVAEHLGRIVIVDFWSCECPHSTRTDVNLAAWHEALRDQVAWLRISANSNEAQADVATVARRRHLPVVLLDRDHRVADLYEAQTTPHIFVIDAAGRLRYRGAADDTTFSKRVPERFFVREVVEQLLAGHAPDIRETSPHGCAIIRDALE